MEGEDNMLEWGIIMMEYRKVLQLFKFYVQGKNNSIFKKIQSQQKWSQEQKFLIKHIVNLQKVLVCLN